MEFGDAFVFRDPEIGWHYLACFEAMKEKRQLCDVVFTVGNVSIYAHRVILAAGIPYFMDIFTTTGVENKSFEIAMPEIGPETLESLVNFAYTGKIEISTQNMLSLFSASVLLRLGEIQEACCQFISKRLSTEIVMKVRKIAEELNCTSLVERSDSYVVEHFGEFSKTNDFLTMPFSNLKKLVYDDYLGVESEEVVFEAVMRWLESSDTERHSVLPELLNGVRMTHLSPSYLFESVASNEVIRASLDCRNLLDEVMFYMLLPEKRRLFRSFETNPRHCYANIYVVCTSKNGCSVTFYNVKNQKYSLLATDCRCDHFVDVLIHGDKMYLFGGKTLGSFDLKTHDWNTLEPTHEHSCGAGVVLHCNRLYTFSLHDSSRQICCFDISQNKWQTEGFMTEYRCRPRVVSVGDSIYVVGGYPDGMCWESGVHNSVERYDPQERKSYSLPSMLVGRYWFGMSALKGRIYVCGGCNSMRRPVSSAEVFDLASKQWHLISSMKISRYSVSLVSCNKKLYAIGGKGSDNKDYPDVEVYDPESNSWTFGVPLNVEDKSGTSILASTG